MKLPNNDTICSLSTPAGMGAIAVVRISGPDTFRIVSGIFQPAGKGKDVAGDSRGVHFGTIGDEGNILDEVLVTFFKNPHSYTGEDVAEISCHGSVFIQQQLLGLLYSKGARQAGPGEFTLRAFMNGKFDLAQAEAVADLIASQSKASHDLAMQQMRGGYSRKMQELRTRLLDFASLIELELDFSEENVEFANRSELMDLLRQIRNEIEQLIGSFSLGNVIKSGIPVAIAGKPNVGKSTLLNAILNEERALVSEIPGTTRDTIEDTVDIGGYLFRFIDTAGLRESEDVIEKMGIERTMEKMEQAAVVLYVFDATEGIPDMDEFFLTTKDRRNEEIILVSNKSDLVKEGIKQENIIYISARNKEGIHEISRVLLDFVQSRDITGSTVVSNARHLEALRNALTAVDAIMAGMSDGVSPDLLTVDIRLAMHHLGEITGDISTDDILGNIFGKFCIGK